MDKDGRILYDPDADEIGRNLFSDPLYQPYHQLIDFGREVIRKSSGKGGYTFLGAGLTKPVKKEAHWATIGLFGTEWRMVVIHEQGGLPSIREKTKTGKPFSEEGLKELSLNESFLSAVSDGKEGEIVRFFRDFYDSLTGV
ncbi:MAG: hypothetical protein HGA78_12625 [Nitrospirales bacterium]|nr:hypothetical protein [Nitrospirales bacterium]